MLEIYKWIYKKLSEVGNVYKGDLERNKEGKAVIDDIKIIYKTPNVLQSADNKNRSNIPLQIDIWAKRDQDIEVEKIVKEINKKLRGKVYRGDIPFFSLEKDVVWRNNIPDDDKNIIRSQLNYVIRVYE